MLIDDMDNLVDYLYKKGSIYVPYRTIVAEHFKCDEINHDVEAMLIKLEKDGYVDTGTFTSDKEIGWTKQTTYKLSYEGRFLYEKSPLNKPYSELKRQSTLKYRLMIAKTIANVANAVMIIAIGIAAIVYSNKNSVKQSQLDTYKDSVQKLNSLLSQKTSTLRVDERAKARRAIK